MKVLWVLLSLLTVSAFAQDPSAYLKIADSKVHSLKTKGVKDFSVDISSDVLTKQVNDQAIFGKVKSLTFRVYWTLSPERMAVEVMGLPEGFKEIKDDLKLNILPFIEDILPMDFEQKFKGYKFSVGSKPKEFVAQDTTGIAQIPSYVLKFDAQDKLTEIVANKFVGTMSIKPTYASEDGKWMLKQSVSQSAENGQSLQATRTLTYGKVQGLSVVTKVQSEVVQKWDRPNTKPFTSNETISFENYRINSGEAMKFFLGENSKQ